MLSREDLTEDEARLVDRLNRRRALIELAHREWDAANSDKSERRYPIGVITQALAGSSDLEKLKGVTPASVTGFTVQELLSLHVSFDGIARVIVQADMQGSSVCQKEPRFTARVLCNKVKDFCNGVLRFVNVKHPARNVELNYKITPFHCSNCKGSGSRLCPVLSDEEIARAYKSFCDGAGTGWHHA